MLSEVTKQIIDNLITQLQADKNKHKLQKFVIDPAIKYILEKLFPYLIGCAVIFCLVILLTLVMIFLIVYDMRVRKLRLT